MDLGFRAEEGVDGGCAEGVYCHDEGLLAKSASKKEERDLSTHVKLSTPQPASPAEGPAALAVT